MTALQLPTWAGWTALTTWGIAWALAGWTLGRHTRRHNAADFRHNLYRTALNELTTANHQADRYRLAWHSARYRAHRPQPINEEISMLLDTISGAVDDYAANRPVEDVIGEIGQAVDLAIKRTQTIQ